MSDPFHPDGLPSPGADALAHGRRAEDFIRRRIEEEGPIPFSDYMELCLNAPGLGYYTAGSGKFGPGGDFVTAPEISPLFGRSVARQFEEVLDLLGGARSSSWGAGPERSPRAASGSSRAGTPPRAATGSSRRAPTSGNGSGGASSRSQWSGWTRFRTSRFEASSSRTKWRTRSP